MTSALTSCPCVRLGRLLFRNIELAVVCPPGCGRFRPLTTVSWSRNGSSGFSTLGNSKFAATALGAQFAGSVPWGQYTAPKRSGRAAAVSL